MRFYLYGLRLPFGYRGGVSVSDREIKKAFASRKVPIDYTQTEAIPFSVYVITNDHGQCKVGFSRDPETRLRFLQIGNPHKLRIAYVCTVASLAREIEAKAHFYLEPFSGEGEWFHCTEGEAIDAVNYAVKSYGKSIVELHSKAEHSWSWWLSLWFWLVILFFVVAYFSAGHSS